MTVFYNLCGYHGALRTREYQFICQGMLINGREKNAAITMCRPTIQGIKTLSLFTTRGKITWSVLAVFYVSGPITKFSSPCLQARKPPNGQVFPKSYHSIESEALVILPKTPKIGSNVLNVSIPDVAKIPVVLKWNSTSVRLLWR